HLIPAAQTTGTKRVRFGLIFSKGNQVCVTRGEQLGGYAAMSTGLLIAFSGYRSKFGMTWSKNEHNDPFSQGILTVI
ncbi:MAG: hypothetical protein AAF564_26395, partial [Bacteroidota bacterium]